MVVLLNFKLNSVKFAIHECGNPVLSRMNLTAERVIKAVFPCPSQFEMKKCLGLGPCH